MKPLISDNVLELVGQTPMVRLKRVVERPSATVLVKLESSNPGGSVKDRIALAMIEAAEAKGVLKAGDTIVEPTSGNTGIGLALVAAVKGYKLIITMPDDKSNERRKLMEHLGAQVILTPARKLMQGAIERAQAIVDSNPRCFMAQQFSNPANPDAHSETTAKEIVAALGAAPDVFVSGVGTGGTVSGVGRVFKAEYPATKIVAIEPFDSQAIGGGQVRPHSIQGIGAGFIPSNLDRTVIDEIYTCDGTDAYKMTRRLAREEGILAGLSAGANVAIAVKLAAAIGPGKTVVTVICDSWERYLSQDNPLGPAPGLDFII
ncbi:MAG: cysteine synthase A [Myxococcota bacterium]|nr:cysteine synthase A [Myxococcota bacterium]